MVIEGADRFGIAQLHQLRGRVGRGTDPSWCYLLGASTDGEDGLAGERLAAVERTTDGFELAEVDLRLRGEGTILGAAPEGADATCGWPRCRIPATGSCSTEARRVAEAIVGEDPRLEAHAAPGRRAPAVPERRRGGVPLQELSRGLGRWAVAAMRVIGGRSRGRRLAGQAPGGGAPHLGPGARVDLRHPRVPGRGRRALGGRPLLRERGAGGRGPVAGRGLGHLRRPGPGRRPGGAGQPGRGRAGRRAGHRGPGRPAGLAGRRRPAFDLALCDPPYDFDGWATLLERAAGGAGRAGVGAVDRAPRGLGGHERAAVRRYARHRGPSHRSTQLVGMAARGPREGRALSRVLRPLPQRAPRDRRAGQPPLRRGGGGRPAQPAEERGAVRPGRAPGDARGGRRPTSRRSGSCRSRPWW